MSLAGTSGGAWAAVNAAMLRPDLVERVVADSFDGRSLAEDFADSLLEERASSKQEEHAIEFYQWCQGDDWESVVDKNTEALVRCARSACSQQAFIRPWRPMRSRPQMSSMNLSIKRRLEDDIQLSSFAW